MGEDACRRRQARSRARASKKAAPSSPEPDGWWIRERQCCRPLSMPGTSTATPSERNGRPAPTQAARPLAPAPSSLPHIGSRGRGQAAAPPSLSKDTFKENVGVRPRRPLAATWAKNEQPELRPSSCGTMNEVTTYYTSTKAPVTCHFPLPALPVSKYVLCM